MRVRVEFFGKLGDFAGAEDGAIDLPHGVVDTSALRDWLDQACGFGGALKHPSVQLALGDEILNADAPLNDGDTVAFLPPVGGG